MHTLESTIVITTVIMCIFGCIFMEKEIFERILVHRELCISAARATNKMKEPLCNEKNGYIGGTEEATNIYHPIGTLMGGNTKSFSKAIAFTNPFKLSFLKAKEGMFTKEKTEYEERGTARNFDPLEVIRMTDQGIEMMLELKGRKDE